jgi:regulator of protease activity HflC (stomatin/prohibitin superfamily)
LRIWVLAILVITAPFLAVAQTPRTNCGMFTVYPSSEALVFDRLGNIDRKVGPGLSACVPFLETVLIEDTFSERHEDVEVFLSNVPCEISVAVIWNISDLEIYYTKGRETAAASGIQELVQEALAYADINDMGIEEIEEIVRYLNVGLHTSLQENDFAFQELGVRFKRALPSFRNCVKK